MHLLLACADEIVLDKPTSAEDLSETCEENADLVQSTTLTVRFAEATAGCAWGEAGNQERKDAHFSARAEESESLALPDSAVACDFGLDFAAVDGGEGTPMVYDDNFAFTFDDRVLATSYGRLVDWLDAAEPSYAWDWSRVLDQPMEFSGVDSWCIGDGSTCEIPAAETRGLMRLDFSDDVANELGYVALDEGRYDFGLVTMGDNDDVDCSHAEFAFEVEVAWLEI